MSLEEVVLQVKMINNLIYNTRDSNIRQKRQKCLSGITDRPQMGNAAN